MMTGTVVEIFIPPAGTKGLCEEVPWGIIITSILEVTVADLGSVYASTSSVYWTR